MKGGIRMLIWQKNASVLVLLASLLLMFPSSASVICIAPGDHVAIESLNALCCSSSGISTQDHYRPGDEPEIAGDCRTCTDLLISLNECGAVPKSYDLAIGGSLDGESCEACFSVIASQLFVQKALTGVIALPAASHSVPLRC
jgi:hypothetical protein